MDTLEIITSQYHAALEMLKQAIARCPEDLWNDQEHKNRFWHISYHVLFYTHLYLQDSEEDFVAWSKHQDESQFLGRLPWPPHAEPKPSGPYAKEDVLEYLELCRKGINERVASLNLDTPSGFSWLPFGKLELQLYNIRHIQHHVGQLADRMRTEKGISVDWVGMWG